MPDSPAICFLAEYTLETYYQGNMSKYANGLSSNYKEVRRVMKRLHTGGNGGRFYAKLIQLYADKGWSVD